MAEAAASCSTPVYFATWISVPFPLVAERGTANSCGLCVAVAVADRKSVMTSHRIVLRFDVQGCALLYM